MTQRTDHTLRELQVNLPWTIHYSGDFRANPQPHKDFAHALTHIGKAAGQLHAFVDDMDHRREAAEAPDAREKYAKYVADLVVCALRLANTFPGGPLDLQAAVKERIEGKNGAALRTPGGEPPVFVVPSLSDAEIEVLRTYGVSAPLAGVKLPYLWIDPDKEKLAADPEALRAYAATAAPPRQPSGSAAEKEVADLLAEARHARKHTPLSSGTQDLIKRLAHALDEESSLHWYKSRQCKLWYKIARAMGYESDGTYDPADFPPHIVSQIERQRARHMTWPGTLNMARAFEAAGFVRRPEPRT